MSDDSPFPPNKSNVSPKSIANLRPPFRKGEVANPKGNNGRNRSEYVAAWLEKADDTELVKKIIRKLGLPEDTPRIDAILQRELVAALGSSDMARKGLRETFAGRPRQQVEMSGSVNGSRVMLYLPAKTGTDAPVIPVELDQPEADSDAEDGPGDDHD
jgi:hypothetical protein